jgi:hypothetical protein
MGISGQATPIAVVVRIIELRRRGWSVRDVMRELDLQIGTVAKYGSCSLIARPDALAVVIAARVKAKAMVAAKRATRRKADQKTKSRKFDGGR